MADRVTKPVRIKSKRSQEFSDLVEIVSQAFFTDPAIVWSFPDVEKRASQTKWIFQGKLGLSIRTDVIHWDCERNGAAIWMPPQHTPIMSVSEIMRSGMLWSPFVLGWETALRTMKAFGKLDEVAKKYRNSGYWYLDILGTKPAAQGKGIGRKLVAQGLSELVGSLGAWLITFNESNLNFYRSFGFEVVEILEGKDHPKFWVMERVPR